MAHFRAIVLMLSALPFAAAGAFAQSPDATRVPAPVERRVEPNSAPNSPTKAAPKQTQNPAPKKSGAAKSAAAKSGAAKSGAAKTGPLAALRHNPLIFFIAKGRPDSCGPGCDTWIGAEGTFDPDAPKRLSNFLAVPGRQRLPIYFHSPGGELQPSIAIGHMLREMRMTAGIGQTIPDGCRETARAEPSCRNTMRTSRELPARLKVASGICASGCAYALIGASTRLIGEGARFGVHSNRVLPNPGHAEDARRGGLAARQAAETQSYDLLRHYVTVAGVDPALIDLATRTPHNRVYWLSRDELERYGLVYTDFFETRWLRHAKPDGSTFIIKSLTQVSPSREHRTTNIAINCVPNTRATVMLRRELGSPEHAPQPVVRLSSGEAFVLVFSHGNRSPGATEVRVQPVAADALARVAASDSIVLREDGAREFRLSTEGLSEAMRNIPLRCGGPA